MDTALKHRLTGAILLVVLAVLLLPELLTGAGNSPREVAETGGSTDVPVRRYDIDLTERAEAPADTPVESPASVAETLPIPTQAPTPEAPPAEPPSAPVPVPQSSPQGSVPKSAPLAAPKPSSQPTAKSSPPTQTPAPAPSTEGVARRYLVQVGVFSSREGADRVAKTLRGQGFTVTVSRYDSGKRLYRVRVGPVADRAEARRLRERLATAGHPGSVVAEGVESRSP